MTYGKIFTALADDTRRSIFEDLRETPRTVSELAANQPVSRPAVSQHLKVLQECGLLKVKPVGTRRLYSIDTDGLALLRDYLDSYWSDVLDAYQREIEKSAKGKSSARNSSAHKPTERNSSGRRSSARNSSTHNLSGRKSSTRNPTKRDPTTRKR